MMIERVTRWRVLGQEFDSVAKAEQAIYDAIGERLEPAMNAANMAPGDKIKLIDAIWKDKATLSRFLSYIVEPENA